MSRLFFCISFLLIVLGADAQRGNWTADGNGNYTVDPNGIHKTDFKSKAKELLVPAEWYTPKGATKPLEVKGYTFSEDFGSVLIFTNTRRVWRYETRGDYWHLNLKTKALKQVGKTLPEASLMFAKLSPDGKQVAYVSKNNLYTEDLSSAKIKQLTFGTGKLISGTFDWVYEEEFDCRDGFRWSPDSKSIAFWEIDANTIRDFYMINTTDSIYAYTIPVEYPKVGESPSACRVGVVNVSDGKTVWMKIPGDNRQHYIPRMDWAPQGKQLILQQLNRKQNHSKLFYADAMTGNAQLFYEEQDAAWVDVRTSWAGSQGGWRWLKGNNDFLWITEKDGWNHIYKVSKDGKKETLVTVGDFDVISPLGVDDEAGYVYYLASPDNATQRYLYRSSLAGNSKAERLTPAAQEGTHAYQISPNGKFAVHTFSNYYTAPLMENITLPAHKALTEAESIEKKFDPSKKALSNVEFFKIKTAEGVEMDGWMAKPKNFDPSKKYPVLFLVYSEPASQTVTDRYGIGRNGMYDGDMAADGYIYMSVDNRGTPAPKGRAWRKSIYRKIGVLNIQDQAEACKAILAKYPFVDASRVAVHGWSGGGSATLNLLFKYPDLYQTGISGAAVANQLTYDNIYQERYMGLPQENLEDFKEGSPVTHAKHLKGNLLYIHGTGDDNVHYQNAEMLINELIKHNRQFQFMPYPNRNHGVREKHLNTLFTNYLKTHCPPGAR
jgi:dipeptidyl-peptidase-4